MASRRQLSQPSNNRPRKTGRIVLIRDHQLVARPIHTASVASRPELAPRMGSKRDRLAEAM